MLAIAAVGRALLTPSRAVDGHGRPRMRLEGVAARRAAQRRVEIDELPRVAACDEIQGALGRAHRRAPVRPRPRVPCAVQRLEPLLVDARERERPGGTGCARPGQIRRGSISPLRARPGALRGPPGLTRPRGWESGCPFAVLPSSSLSPTGSNVRRRQGSGGTSLRHRVLARCHLSSSNVAGGSGRRGARVRALGEVAGGAQRSPGHARHARARGRAGRPHASDTPASSRSPRARAAVP
jgi:hypothetical protein